MANSITKFDRIDIEKVLKYLEIFVLWLLVLGPINTNVKVIIYVFLMLYNIKYLNCLIKLNKFTLLLILMMIIPMILDIRNVDASNPYSLASFYFLLPYLVSKVWTKKYEYSEFIDLLEKEIIFFSVISLIGFTVLTFAPEVIRCFPTVVYNGREEKTILVYGAIHMDDIRRIFLHRNCGIAYEPGAFQYLPNLGLAIMFNYKKDESKFKYFGKMIIYILTIVTTSSTMGLVIMAVLFLHNYFSRKNIVVMTLLMLGASGMIITIARAQITKMQGGSFASRFGNSFYVIQNYLRYPLGIGSTGYNKIFQINKMIGAWDMYSQMFLRFGLPFLFLFLILNFQLVRLNKDIFLVVVLTLLTEGLVGPITVMLYYYALEKRDEQLMWRRKNEGCLDMQCAKSGRLFTYE